MVSGKIVNIEKEQINYRAMRALNYSGIKLFDEDPLAFYNEFILQIKRKFKKSAGILIGDVGDFFTLDCDGDEQTFEQRFDERFGISGIDKGTKQVFILADELFKLTERDINPSGEITTTFSSRFEEAFSIVQSDGKYSGKKLADGLKDFSENAKEYFDKKIENIGKELVDLKLIEISKRVGNQLITDPFTAYAFKSDEGIEVHKKFPITWEWILDSKEKLLCKSELDIMHIDHYRKLILLKDQKITYDNENFEYSYLKYKYYLQNSFYYMAACYWRDENLKDYEVVAGMEFIVGDSSFNGRRPLVYETNMTDVKNGLNGFSAPYGKKFKGISELIEEIAFCIDHSSWNISRKAFENNGRLKLNIFE